MSAVIEVRPEIATRTVEIRSGGKTVVVEVLVNKVVEVRHKGPKGDRGLPGITTGPQPYIQASSPTPEQVPHETHAIWVKPGSPLRVFYCFGYDGQVFLVEMVPGSLA